MMYIKIEWDYNAKCFDWWIKIKNANAELLRKFVMDAMPSIMNTMFKNVCTGLMQKWLSKDELISTASLIALWIENNVSQNLIESIDDLMWDLDDCDNDDDDCDDECWEWYYCEEAVKKNLKSNKKKK